MSNPAQVGVLGPLIPFHKDAIHAGLGWTKDNKPRICFWMRPAEYRGIDLVDPLAPPGPGALRTETFRTAVYGFEFEPLKGFNFSTGPNGIDESVATRIQDDLYRDNGLCFDLDHPDAFKNSGKFDIAALTDADFAANSAAFSNAGHSRGLDYNLFCAGQVALSNGEWVFVGGHDKAGNNGIRKVLVFNPTTRTWVPRVKPPVKTAFLEEPDFTDPARHPDPNDEANTDPADPSDMKYQRWYPTAVHLPDDTVLVLSGTDQETSLVRNPGRCTSALHSPNCSKYRANAPEVYDRTSDSTIALESARKLLSMYPIAYVVQTGPHTNDWKVAVIGEADHAEGGPYFGDFRDHRNPTGFNIAGFDPWPYSGKTYLFDVQAAIADPSRGVQDDTGKHWQHVATAAIAHESGASSMLVKLDAAGKPVSQKLVLLGGGCGDIDCPSPGDRATVEMIDFQDDVPTWRRQESLVKETSQLQAVALPDGKVIITGGSLGRPNATAVPPQGWDNSFHYQLFDPDTGTISPLVETTNPWHDHATMLLLPNGSILNMGGNRTDKVFFTDPLGITCALGEQCSTQATRNAGVPVAQVYQPPYFHRGSRPIIETVPAEISYKELFKLEVSSSRKLEAIAMIQQHPTTHNHQWNRRVELWFQQTKKKVLVRAPRLAGTAPPGDYLLFAVDERGIPSTGRRVRLLP